MNRTRRTGVAPAAARTGEAGTRRHAVRWWQMRIGHPARVLRVALLAAALSPAACAGGDYAVYGGGPAYPYGAYPGGYAYGAPYGFMEPGAEFGIFGFDGWGGWGREGWRGGGWRGGGWRGGGWRGGGWRGGGGGRFVGGHGGGHGGHGH